MKERELEELFRAAADTAPPASFDEQDIARGARRVTARRRMAAAGGSLVAAGVLVVGVGTGTGLFTPDVTTQAGPTQSVPSQERNQEPAEPRQGQPPGGDSGPTVLSLPGGDQVEPGCGPPDQQLATVLARELPAVSESTTPVPAASCPTGSRTASFSLRHGDAAGTVTAILSPVASVPPEQRQSGHSQQPNGTTQVTQRADSGRVLIVRSNPDAGSAPPYGDRLEAIADRLAGRF